MYRAAETGRQHHLGSPPPRQPVLADDGTGWTAAAAPRLRELHDAELAGLAERLRAAMAAASARLAFEEAAGLREELRAVEAERARRA